MVNLKYTMIFLRHAGRLLLLNRKKAPEMGMWTGVGGKIEPDESPVDCAQREVFEETGIWVDQLQFAGLNTWFSGVDEPSGMGDVPQLSVSQLRVRPVDEGVLDWKETPWILDPDNHGIPIHVKTFLPNVLAHEIFEHRCFFEGNQIVKFERIPL